MADIKQLYTARNQINKAIDAGIPEDEINAYLQEEGLSFSDIEKSAPIYGKLDTLSPQQQEAFFQQNIQSRQTQQEGRESLEAAQTGLDALRAVGQGTTFGLADEGEALLGEPIENIRSEMSQFSEKNPIANFALQTGGAILGGGLSGLASKGAGFVSQGANLGARIGRGALLGAGSGAVQGFTGGQDGLEGRLSNVPVSAGVGGAVGGLAGAIAGGAQKLASPYSSKARLAGKKTGIENIVDDKGSIEQLKTAVRFDDDIAKQAEEFAPKMREVIVKKTSDKVDDIFGAKKFNPIEQVEKSKDRITRFYALKGKQPISITDDVVSDLNAEQRGFLQEALKRGASRTNDAPNSLNSIAEAKRHLQDLVGKSMNPDPRNAMILKPTSETAQLQKVVSKLDDTISNQVQGYKNINRQFTQAKKVEDAFTMGSKLKFDDTITDVGDVFKSNVEKQAFKQGVADNVKRELLRTATETGENTPSVLAKKQAIFGDILGKKEGTRFAKLLSGASNKVKDANSIQATAYRTLEKDMSEVPLLREIMETQGSAGGYGLQKLMSLGQGRARSETARQLLQSGKEFAPITPRTGSKTTMALSNLYGRQDDNN